MSPWKPIETAPKERKILIRYFKGNKSCRTHVSDEYIITEAYYDESYWGGASWFDALERLIVTVGTKSPKNIITHWMEKPEEPED